jgi:hypothetical protein
MNFTKIAYTGSLLIIGLGIAVNGYSQSLQTVLLFTQPISFGAPTMPTGGLYYGLNLVTTPYATSQPLAMLTATGSHTFTSDDPGFSTIAAYILDLNPDYRQALFPYFGYQGEEVGNWYGGHFDNYPGGPGHPANPVITEIVFNVDPIAEFQDAGGFWSARQPDGAQAFVDFSIVGLNLVPEPSSLALLLLGGVMILFGPARRRHCKTILEDCSHSDYFY